MGKKIDDIRKNFKDILFNLSSSQLVLSSEKERKKFYFKLKNIYSNNEFRHFYSDIFSVITQIDKTNGYNIDILSQNIKIIKDYCENKTDDKELPKRINKLYDHINLDVSRLNYFKKAQTDTISQLQNLKNSQEKVLKEIEEFQKKSDEKIAEFQEKSDEKINELQKQSITVLGIFSSIVLTVTGAYTFSTATLGNIAKVGLFKFLSIVLVLAFVLTNITYIMVTNVIIEKKAKIKNKFIIILNVVYILSIACFIILSKFFEK